MEGQSTQQVSSHAKAVRVLISGSVLTHHPFQGGSRGRAGPEGPRGAGEGKRSSAPTNREHPAFGMDTQCATREGSGSPGAQIPAGTRPRPPCAGLSAGSPQPGPAQLGWLWRRSLSQLNPAGPPQCPSTWQRGGAELEPPHTWMRTHLQPSPLICFVNSFSLEGAERAAVKRYPHVKQVSSHPRDRRGAAPACRPLPAPHPSAPQGGEGWAGTEAGPGSADTLRHSRDEPPPPSASAPLQQNRSSNAAFPHTQSAI